MAIKFAISAFVWAPVVLVLAGDMGQSVEVTFKAKFRRMKASERQVLLKELQDKTITDKALLDRVLVDWADLTDADGNAVPFTPDARQEATEEMAGLEAELVVSYFNFVFNPKKDDAAKNS